VMAGLQLAVHNTANVCGAAFSSSFSSHPQQHVSTDQEGICGQPAMPAVQPRPAFGGEVPAVHCRAVAALTRPRRSADSLTSAKKPFHASLLRQLDFTTTTCSVLWMDLLVSAGRACVQPSPQASPSTRHCKWLPVKGFESK